MGAEHSGGFETPSLFDRADLPAIPVSPVRSAAYYDASPGDDPDAADDAAKVDTADPASEGDAAETASSEPLPSVRQLADEAVALEDAPRRREATLPDPVDVEDSQQEEQTIADTKTQSVGKRTKANPKNENGGKQARRKSSKAVNAESMASRQRDISVSEFFAKNRHLLGFDNKRKALLTTVKEAVDNSLDACEEAGILPDLHITIDQLAEDRFRVRVRDNGPGILKQQIPNIFGKLLYGSKFHRLKMSRGQQGIGISAAGMYGLLTTGKSVKIISRTGPRRDAHYFELQMDTTRNKPQVIKDEVTEVNWEQGTEVAIELVASFAKGRQSVDEYIEQTAIANPHAAITYVSPTREVREFPRASEELPTETSEIKPHPHGIELGVLMKMLKEATGQRLAGFLQNSFCRISGQGAQKVCALAKLSPKAYPTQIGTHDVESLYAALQNTSFIAPPTDCLAPIGVRGLLAGMLKEVKAEFYTATTRSPAVYRGNPFQIEIALAYGGSLPKEGTARVIRFANRVPLLYQQSACVAFKSVLEVDWRNYGMSQPSGSLPQGPLVVMVHMASVWVPFTSESKEAIADYDEIRKEVVLALRECGRKLNTYVRRRRRQKLEADKRNIFERYIPDVADALANLTGRSEDRLLADLQAIARRRTAIADMEMDEDGNPIKPAKPEPEQEFADDGSTVVVPENEAREIPDSMFEEEGNGRNGRVRKRKSSRRRKR